MNCHAADCRAAACVRVAPLHTWAVLLCARGLDHQFSSPEMTRVDGEPSTDCVLQPLPPSCSSLCGGRLLRGQCGIPVQGDGVVGPGPGGALDRPVRGGGGGVDDHGAERRAAGVCAAVAAGGGGGGVCASKQGGSGAGGMLASLLGDLHKCIT